MASRIEIENWALLYLEEDTETDINDSSAGQTIDLLYDSVFRQLLKKNVRLRCLCTEINFGLPMRQKNPKY